MNPLANTRQKKEADRIGLCAHCTHMRRMQNDRGSTFYLCELSASDPRFPKYPRLPVIQCAGYRSRSPEASAGED